MKGRRDGLNEKVTKEVEFTKEEVRNFNLSCFDTKSGVSLCKHEPIQSEKVRVKEMDIFPDKSRIQVYSTT